MSTINRAELLQRLESAQPGLSPTGAIQQSSCFVFKNGWAYTYNDEVGVRAKTGLSEDVYGAVPGQPLLEVLRGLEADEVDVEAAESELTISHKRHTAKVRLERDIQLPFESVDRPDEWRRLPEEFVEALKLVKPIVERKAANVKFKFKSVHLHPEWVEATDAYQVARFNVKLPVSKSILVRAEMATVVAGFEPTRIAETDNWVHFRNKAPVVLSVRRWDVEDDYPDLARLLKFSGEPVTLPKALAKDSELAEIFSRESDEKNHLVTVELNSKKKQIIVTGEGTSGKLTARPKLNYDGRSLTFRIAPFLLREIVEKHNKCEVGENDEGKPRLVASSPQWRYLTVLGQLPSANGEVGRESEKADRRAGGRAGAAEPEGKED